MLKKMLRPFKRIWRLANSDIVRVRCPRCTTMIDAYSKHACPQVAIIVVMRTKRRTYARHNPS
jgi:phage FluMu protein Com